MFVDSFGSKTGAVDITTANLADGVYFYTLTFDGVTLGTKRLVILK